MDLTFIGARWACVAGLASAIGCVTSASSASLRRQSYPEYPSPSDPLAYDPCSVKSSPDIFLHDAPFDLLQPLQGNLKFLKDANPVFLCGLERVEVLGDEAYRTGADPKYTRRSVALYTTNDRVVRLKGSAGIVLTHEVGHHVQNLGYFAPTVRAFLDQSWTPDRRHHRCEGDDCFLGAAAASEPAEDWARTFDYVLMRPIETSVAVNFRLQSTEETPIQKKLALMRSLLNEPAVVTGRVSFGKARTLSDADAEALIGIPEVTTMPDSLSHDMVRRIFRLGQRVIKNWVWEKRQRPFLAGAQVVFPVYLFDKKRLGFFAYDLIKDGFVALELLLSEIPSEFQAAADSFTDLRIVDDPAGGLLLIGKREKDPALAAPVRFEFP